MLSPLRGGTRALTLWPRSFPLCFSFETLIPAGASSLLHSLLDVVSRLGRLLPRASRVLERLPEFLRSSGISALLDVPGFQQVRLRSGPRGHRAVPPARTSPPTPASPRDSSTQGRDAPEGSGGNSGTESRVWRVLGTSEGGPWACPPPQGRFPVVGEGAGPWTHCQHR